MLGPWAETTLMEAVAIHWEHDLAQALERATRERRFVLADFGKEP